MHYSYPFYCPVRFYIDPETRSNKWDDKARAGWYVGPSPENSTTPYIWDSYTHITAGAGMQAFTAFAFDTNAKGNERSFDTDWAPNTPPSPPRPPLCRLYFLTLSPPTRTAVPSPRMKPCLKHRPLAQSRTRRRQPLHPFSTPISSVSDYILRSTVTSPSAIAPTKIHPHASILSQRLP